MLAWLEAGAECVLAGLAWRGTIMARESVVAVKYDFGGWYGVPLEVEPS
jgi:hypothetical protein